MACYALYRAERFRFSWQEKGAYQAFTKAYPQVDNIMIGRGFLVNLQYLFVTHKFDADTQNAVADKYMKKIREAMKAAEYEAAVNGLFSECEIREGASFEG